MSGRIQVERLDYTSGWSALEPEWDELLRNSIRPTVFSTYDYISTSLKHFQADHAVFLLLFREAASGKLLAIFPLSLCHRKIHGVWLRVVKHALPPQETEVDKPGPVILRGEDTECWSRFAEFFNGEFKDWDLMELDELVSESRLPCVAKELFPFPYFWTRVKAGPDSPMVDLSGTFEEFWKRHRKLRKKCGRLERRIENLSYRITGEPAEVETCLNAYIETEVSSWKNGEMVGFHKDFYADLMEKLAGKNQLWFGMMYDGDKVVSVEVAYTYLDKVYFCHGTYSPEYAVHSPGMVNACWMIKHFLGKGFREGDYLAGFADYIAPWAYRFEHTGNVTIRRMNGKCHYLGVWHLLGKIKRRVLGLRKRNNHED